MVNAAAGTEHLIGRYAPRAILNYGCAGAHRRDILPGDVIIGDGTVHHGAVHILASGEEFFPGKDYEVTGEAVASTELATDRGLRDLAIAAAEGWTPEPWPQGLNLPPEIEQRAPRTHVGRSCTSASTASTPVMAHSAKTWKPPPSPRSADATACPS
jgi:nucleoside phosphorylase